MNLYFAIFDESQEKESETGKSRMSEKQILFIRNFKCGFLSSRKHLIFFKKVLNQKYRVFAIYACGHKVHCQPFGLDVKIPTKGQPTTEFPGHKTNKENQIQ